MKKTHRLRVLIAAALSLAAFGVIEVKLYTVQVRDHGKYAARADGQQNQKRRIYPTRGDILARDGQVLATSTFYETMYFEPAALEDPLPPALIARLAPLIDRSEFFLEGKLSHRGRVLTQRKVPPETVDAVRGLLSDLDLSSRLFTFEKESMRIYPQGELAGPLIGVAGLDTWGDNRGLMGLELAYDEELRGHKVDRRIAVTSGRNPLEPLDEEAIRSSYGRSLKLTLDREIQRYAQKALVSRVGQVQARDGAAIVIDVRTGAILAMASCPGFDPNAVRGMKDEQQKIRAVTEMIEIGSVMKAITAAIWIDHGLLLPDDTIDCEEGRVVLRGDRGERRTITDSHALGKVPYREAFAQSSNIAHAKLGLMIDKALYYDSLRKFGLGQRSGIRLPGEARGLLRPISKWDWYSVTSLPWGYESQMTALQVVSAFAAIGNDGRRMQPYLVQELLSAEGRTLERTDPISVARVASAEACRMVLEMMEEVVVSGTGTDAAVPGYRVGGKTGTTMKTGGSSDADPRYIASFAGLLPIDDPRIAIYVYINEPKREVGPHYGGPVAGPVFAEIAYQAARILGIPPSGPSAAEHVNPPERLAAAGPADDSPEPPRPGASPPMMAKRYAGATAPVMPRRVPLPGGSGLETGEAGAGEAGAVMPSFLGMTLFEALELQAASGIELIRMRGSGIALHQSPAASAPLVEGEDPRVIFAAPSRRISPGGEWFPEGGELDGGFAAPEEPAPSNEPIRLEPRFNAGAPAGSRESGTGPNSPKGL